MDVPSADSIPKAAANARWSEELAGQTLRRLHVAGAGLDQGIDASDIKMIMTLHATVESDPTMSASRTSLRSGGM